MRRILITAGTTAIALRVKKMLSTKFLCSLGTSGDIPSVLNSQYIKLPQIASSSYSHEILKIALSHNIEYILPLEALAVMKLSNSLVLFEEYDITILVPKNNILNDLSFCASVPKEIDILVLDKGIDIVTDNKTDFLISGSGIVSDSQEEFVLIGV